MVQMITSMQTNHKKEEKKGFFFIALMKTLLQVFTFYHVTQTNNMQAAYEDDEAKALGKKVAIFFS